MAYSVQLYPAVLHTQYGVPAGVRDKRSRGCCSLTSLTYLECMGDDFSAMETNQFLSTSLRELKLASVGFSVRSLGLMLQGFQKLTTLKIVQCEQMLSRMGEQCLVLPPAVR